MCGVDKNGTPDFALGWLYLLGVCVCLCLSLVASAQQGPVAKVPVSSVTG